MGQPADRALFSSRGVGLDFYPTHNQDLSLDLEPPPPDSPRPAALHSMRPAVAAKR